MQELVNIYLANNLEDLEQLSQKQLETKGRKPHMLKNALKTLHTKIVGSSPDQEKCFIFCYRYLTVIEKLCQIEGRDYINLLYRQELARVQGKMKELTASLERRYEEERRKGKQKQSLVRPVSRDIPEVEPLFSGEFISVKQLYKAIQSNMDILVVDIRPANEYLESKIKFEKIINIPEDLLVAGLSANIIGSKLQGDPQKIWDKRDTFKILVFLDWNSGSDNVTCTKLNFLRASVTEWDSRRNYKQAPVVLNGGFKEFLDSYPSSVTNVHVNFVRHNEDIDELLELENISYPEENAAVMHLKQFTIQELENSVTIEDSDDDQEEPSEPAPQLNEDVIKKDNEIIVAPKGGGSSIDKISPEITKDESIDLIKNKIEEERVKLLNEARNKKNKVLGGKQDTVKFSEGDSVGHEPKIKLPPPIRRETKPKKNTVFLGGWCGLVNIKNTCYMNTILQCLKCIPIIRNIVQSNFTQYVTRRPTQIIYEFASVIKTLCEGTEYNKKVFRPSSFYDSVCKLDPVYKKGDHEDCMEFFLFLFNHLNDDCATDIPKRSIMIEREKSWYAHLQGRTSFWVDLFYHQFKCTKICQVCHLTADSYETDNTLMLSVPYKPSLRMVHLKELIHEYMEDNQILDYKCSKCQNMKVINKKSIVVEPEILVIVLKRYYQDEYQETRKNNVCVNFDSSFTFGNYLYKLYSVAQHRGTMDHGHYYGHGLLSENVWAEFNDERTVRFDKDWDSLKGSACAFFYCKDKKRNT